MSINNYLSQVFDVPVESVNYCSSLIQKKEVVKGDFLLREGEICNETFFVEKGLLRMYSIDKNGKEHIIQFAPENWLISDRSSLFFNSQSEYFIDAVELTEVLSLGRDFFTDLRKTFPSSGENNNIILQKHIRNLQDRINSLLADSAEERYMKFIKMYPDILQRVPQWMVASYLGITPESLSRVRKELARKNFKPSN